MSHHINKQMHDKKENGKQNMQKKARQNKAIQQKNRMKGSFNL